MNVHELAHRLGVSESFIYKRIQRHKIPFIKIGILIRFDSEQIQDWLQSNCSKSTKRITEN